MLTRVLPGGGSEPGGAGFADSDGSELILAVVMATNLSMPGKGAKAAQGKTPPRVPYLRRSEEVPANTGQ
ncbi:hypothetical protein GCM10017709_05040 [Glutamicibacter nicotianae]